MEDRSSNDGGAYLSLLFQGLGLAAFLVLLGPPHRNGPSLWCAIFFGHSVVTFGFKIFNRLMKIAADGQGIQDFRASFRMIGWSETESLKTSTINHSIYLNLYFRNPAKWLPRASRFTQWQASKTIKLGASMSLQTMDVDNQQFVRFINSKIVLSAAGR